MPATDSPAIIVARFLKANNYTESYDAFIAEAGLPPDAGMVSAGDLTLETLLQEKKAFDLSMRFEKLGTDGGEKGWSFPAPALENAVTSLPSTSNILSVYAERVKATEDDGSSSMLFVSTADRRLHVLDTVNRALRSSLSGLQDAPILSCAIYKERHLLTTSMSGQVLVSDIEGRTIDKRRDHSKYVVKVAIFEDAVEPLIATAGWDGKVNIYKPTENEAGEVHMGEPVAAVTLATKPESILFLRHPEAGKPILLLSRTDSSFIHYYTTESQPRLLGRQNLAPHSNAWVAFTPCALELCPTDPSLLAVGTSSVPHMKLLIVRLLVPPYDQEASASQAPAPQRLRTSLLDDSPVTETQASQARAALAVADREAAAIQIHCTTMAPQTAYSTPAVAWRPDGTGVWVNGDDGTVRGVETTSGKVVATLQGHDPGSKVRCLWAGVVGSAEEDADTDVLVSGGFDQKLIFWTAASS